MERMPVSPPMTFRGVDQQNWPDFEKLFEARGGPKACWCMVWRAPAEEPRQAGRASRKEAMAERISRGIPVGILGYLHGEPVAWCSVAPRNTHRKLVSDGSPDEGVWSITCFYVVRRLRGSALARLLLEGAVGYARRHGAHVVESYPVDPDSPSYRFMGFVQMFADAGFEECGREGLRRHVMRLKIAERPGPRTGPETRR